MIFTTLVITIGRYISGCIRYSFEDFNANMGVFLRSDNRLLVGIYRKGIVVIAPACNNIQSIHYCIESERKFYKYRTPG